MDMPKDAALVDREVLETVAREFGRNSAAQQALNEADRIEAEGQTPVFFKSGATIFVVDAGL